MPDPATLRDSTQILLRSDAFERVCEDLDAEFTLTSVEVDDDWVRIVGSPVEIKGANDFLSRRGVTLP